MMPAYRKDVAEVIKYARQYGWECTGMTGTGHWRLQHKTGAKITVAATPRSQAWRKRAISDIHKYGTPKDSK
jgi:hypothetical protein